MTNEIEIKEQQAQEYAEKKIQETIPEEYRHDEQIYDADDIKYAYKQAYSDGYTACEQSMWHSVEEELPEFDKRVLICERVADKQRVFIGRRIQFSNGGWDWSQTTKESVTHWSELPSIPDTNNEKK